MLKKLLVGMAILAASSSVAVAALAPAPYLGGSIGLVNNSSHSSSTVGGNSVYRGLTGNINLGYGGIVSPGFYLAGELFGTPGTISVSGDNDLKTSWGVGGSIIPGVMINDRTFGYARLGINGTRFTSADVTRFGGHAGLGLQTNLCQNWDLRGEYVYTKYRSVGGISSPNSDLFNLGVVYRFE